jgi:hypothetical protein
MNIRRSRPPWSPATRCAQAAALMQVNTSKSWLRKILNDQDDSPPPGRKPGETAPDRHHVMIAPTDDRPGVALKAPGISETMTLVYLRV